MANQDRWCRAVSTKVAFLTLAGTRAKRVLIVTGMLGVAFSCAAQEGAGAAPAQDTQGNSPTVTSLPHGAVTIPAGTRFALVLTNPVASKSMRRGDEIYTQTIAPVLVGDQVVIPPGAFVQGKLDKLTRNGTRAQMRLQSASVVFPDGFVASAAGAIVIEGEEGTAWPVAGGGNVAGAIAAPLAGLGLGTLIGHSVGGKGTDINGMNFNPGGLKSTAIGGMVGLAAGGVISFILIAHTHHFFVDAGSPMKMTLPEPLTLAQNQVNDAVRDAQAHPVTPMPVAKRPIPPPIATPTSSGTCYTPETPGTAPTVIPGTPAIGDTPGTPDIIVPGTPAIPGTPYPCP
jgi:hypothetical protein